MNLSEKNVFINNVKWLAISKLILYILSIITITLIPRYLGVEAYGQLNFAIALISFFIFFGDMGLSTLIFRDISRDKSRFKEYFNKLFYYKLILLGILFIVGLILTLVINKPLIVKEVIIIYLIYVIIISFETYLLSYLDGLEQMKYRSIYDVLNKLIFTIIVLVVIALNYKLIGIVLSYLLASLFCLLYLLVVFKKHIKFKPTNHFSFFKQKLLIAWPFALTGLFGALYFSVDRVMISFFSNDYQVGLYSIGYTFYLFVVSLILIFSTAFYPLLSKNVHSKNLVPILNKFSKVILLLIIPISLGSLYLAKGIIKLIFGSAYLPGLIAFQIILGYFLLSSINIIFHHILTIFDFQKYQLKVIIFATIVNFILNLFMIPLFGITGAAISTVICELFIFITIYLFTRKQCIKFKFWNKLTIPVVSSLLMIGMLYFIDVFGGIHLLPHNLDVLIYCLIGVITYGIFILLFRYITKEEITLVISSFRK